MELRVISTLNDVTCLTFFFFGRTFTTKNSRVEFRRTGGEEESLSIDDEKEQEQSYAVISMVCGAVSPPLAELAPSGSVLVVLRPRTPSVEPTLEAE